MCRKDRRKEICVENRLDKGRRIQMRRRKRELTLLEVWKYES